MNRISLRLSAALFAVLWAAAAHAASDSASFAVTATVVKTCRITADAAVPIGNYDPFTAGGATSGPGKVTVKCTKGGNFTLTLDKGAHDSIGDGTGTRQMTNGTEFLPYELYTDLAATSAWPASVVVASAAGMSGDVYTVVAKIPEGQDVSVGAYSDTVTATIQF